MTLNRRIQPSLSPPIHPCPSNTATSNKGSSGSKRTMKSLNISKLLKVKNSASNKNNRSKKQYLAKVVSRKWKIIWMLFGKVTICYVIIVNFSDRSWVDCLTCPMSHLLTGRICWSLLPIWTKKIGWIHTRGRPQDSLEQICYAKPRVGAPFYIFLHNFS